jgi:hypothetical protein
MVYNLISLCISVLSVPSVVKKKTVEITFNHRDHRGHRDTQSTENITLLIDHVIFYIVLIKIITVNRYVKYN